jgi:hypothetical protein
VKKKVSNIIIKIPRKGGRVVECSGFENQRGFRVTGGSNPSLSEIKIEV